MSGNLNRIGVALLSASLTLAPLAPAFAGSYSGYPTYAPPPDCTYKNSASIVNINKNINIFKPVVINKNININKNIDINKNININKNVVINKNIVINKVDAVSSANAAAIAAATAQSATAANVIVYSGSYEIINYNNRGIGGAIAIAATNPGGTCRLQEATVVKSIHAVCMTDDGREFPASHMTGETWIESSYDGEVARCIAGSRLKVTIGEVSQSDQGLAGSYEHGQVLACGDHEALRHFKDGAVKCAPAMPVPDCTERTNLRRYGGGDFFFSFRAKVCVTETAENRETPADVTGLPLDGGVGPSSGY